MSENEDKDKDKDKKKASDEKKEEEETAGSSKDEEKNQSKTDKKVIRFQLPSTDAMPSEESFTSALSFASAGDDYEDFAPQAEVPLGARAVPVIFTKYITAPLRHTQPRTPVLNPCIRHNREVLIEEQPTYSLLATSSSRQLFEVTRNSPTPSDFDMNLINSTYLRKLDSVKEAINNGADVNTFRERQTPLLIATEIGDDRLVAYFLTVPNINPDFRNIFGQTPTYVAVRNSFENILRLLLSHNADVNIADYMGKTPLHCALFQQNAKMVKLLLAYGANCETEDCFGERPLYTSTVKKPNLECLLSLLRMGASINYVNITGIPILSRAIMNWTEFSVIETLVQYGASVNALDLNTKKTPLHYAALTDDVQTAKFLVQRGAQTNAKTTYQFTAYDEAVFHRSEEVAEFLADKTAPTAAKFSQFLRYRP